MNFEQFYTQFPTEQSCIEHFKAYRDKIGFTCPKCEGKDHYWLKTINYYKCKGCGRKNSLKSGTLLENTKLPYKYWYTALFFMSSTKKSFSALELQRQIGHEYYEPIWNMMHAIRRGMGKRDSEYLLKDVVEIDEGFFVGTQKREVDELGNTIPKAPLKKGKGSQRTTKVLVMTESIPVADNKGKYKTDRAIKHIKMQCISDTKAQTVLPEIFVAVDKNATAITDGANHYNGLGNVVKKHIPIKMKEKKDAEKHLPWVHKVISNSKRNILGIHHSISNEFMQNYMDEFCFKFNRRYNNIDVFDRLINVAVLYKWN